MMFNVEDFKVSKEVFAKKNKSWSCLSTKRHLWLVTQVATDDSLPTVRISHLFYRSDVIQASLLLYFISGLYL
jgi:hypothetical protein